MNTAVDLFATSSRFAIAAAIVYFAYQLAQINDNLPQVMQTVDGVSQHIEPSLAEVTAIRAEITEVRKLIPEILDEVAQIRQQIPPILEQVDGTRQQIPEILSTADRALDTLDTTRDEVIPLVEKSLEEVKLTREIVNPTLDRVEVLIDDTFVKAQDAIAGVEDAGKKASEGAVKGFFTGIIKLPFQLVGTMASPIVKSIDSKVAKQLTEEDMVLMVKAGEKAVKSEKAGKQERWENSDSGNFGSITINRVYQIQDQDCVEARVLIETGKGKKHDKTNDYCQNDDKQWTLASEAGKQ